MNSRPWIRLGICSLIFLTVSTGTAFAEIRWLSGTTELAPKTPEEMAAMLTELAARPDARHVVVQFDQPVAPALRNELAAAGLSLLNYLGNNAFFAGLSDGQIDAAALAAVPGFKKVAAVERNWKLHPDLIQGVVHDYSVVSPKNRDGQEDPIVGAYVLFHPDVVLDPDAVRICLEHGAWIRSKLGTINGLVIELPYSAIPALADQDAVQWVEPPLPKFSEVNDDNRTRTGANIVQAAPYGLNGSGVNVLVYDGGFASASHQDFGGRLTVRDSSGLSNHATHVSGTVGGSGAASGGTFKGMAPAVTIQSYGFEQEGGLHEGFLYTDPGDLQDDYNQAINTYGAVISNNSIGTNTAPNGFPCDWEGNYAATSILIDSIVGGSLGAPFRIVWANGNERQTSRCLGVEGFPVPYHSTAPPACAKNHITVGALNSNDDSVTSFTSFGPCDDGRIKPDVSAPGCQSSGDFGVTSCSSSGGYTSLCGTSMASPTTCGLSALLLQDFRVQYPGEPDFRNSTLKVFLAHTAVDLFNPGPDYQTGYGSVRIQPAVDLMRSGNFLEDVVGHGQTFSVLCLVNPGDPQLKVTLAWDDVPGTANVNPILVNDLDLRVFDASNTQYFPWTLDPMNPSAPAVQTQADHVNNIEQVVINAPAPGVYRVDIVGLNVPQGPQTFSIAATPQLIACSQAGIVALDRVKYACGGTATVRVVDCDLNTDDTIVETISITVVSDSEPAGETIILTETAAETAAFEGSLPLSTTDAAGVLLVADGDNVSVTYTDADDGQGGTNVPVTANAIVDCQPPVISNVQATNIQPRSATITFDTDEPANSVVHYGTNCAALVLTADESGFHTAHSVNLTGLNDNTTYYYSIDVVDEADNLATDDNGGACYFFTTPEVPEFFTEEFGGDNDLDNLTLLFTPSLSVDQYDACVESITELPTDPAGSTTLTLSDDSSQIVNLTGGATVSLYGVDYGSFYVGSNGYITFGSGDSDYTESLTDHFDQPRISALFDDLNPSTGGTVSWKQTSESAVVTYQNVPEYGTTNQNTFQVEMYFNGNIRISYLDIAAADGIAGLSQGQGLPPDFFESDLSAYGNCGPRPPVALPVNAAGLQDTELVVKLQGTDDGLPDPPGALTYIITSLPSQELRDPGNDQVMSTVPYSLINNGFEVIYAPATGFTGADAFQYKVNDGGTPPEGGDSNVAPVNVVVTPVLSLPFFDDFPSTIIDTEKWEFIENAVVDDVGIDEPSEPYSLRLNAIDRIHSRMINLAGRSPVQLTYYWERTGGGSSPEDGDDLFVEYLDSASQWQIIHQHLGNGPDMTSYQYEEVTLPAGAYHSGFRLRFRTVGIALDEWFVDDVGLSAQVAECTTPCGDIDNSGGPVSLQDFASFALCFGGLPSSSQACACSDLNGDALIDLVDFATFSLGFGDVSTNTPPNCP